MKLHCATVLEWCSARDPGPAWRPRDTAREKNEAAATQAERSRGYTFKAAAKVYEAEHLSKLARGSERWRILKCNILLGLGHRLFARPARNRNNGRGSTCSPWSLSSRPAGDCSVARGAPPGDPLDTNRAVRSTAKATAARYNHRNSPLGSVAERRFPLCRIASPTSIART